MCVPGGREHISAFPAPLRAPIRRVACVPTSVLWSPHPSPAQGHCPSVLQGLALLTSLPRKAFLSDYLPPPNGIQSLPGPLQWHSTFYGTVHLREHLFSLPGEPYKLLELGTLTGLTVTCPQNCTPRACSVSAYGKLPRAPFLPAGRAAGVHRPCWGTGTAVSHPSCWGSLGFPPSCSAPL